jgi:hypothetical protein
MSQPPADDDLRDAHLLTALRHAPDRDVTPPAHVSAAILGHARQAVRAPKAHAPAWPGSLRAAFERLWQPAPMAAFGTLAMATLIGVLWGGQDAPDATPSLRSAPAAAAPPLASAAASIAVAPVLPEAARTDAKGVTAAPITKAPVAAPPVPATPAPAPATTATATAGAAAELPPPREALGKSPADAMPAAASARSEAAPPAIGAVARTAAAPLASVSAEIDAVANSEPTRVRWRVAAQRVVAHDAAQRDWWSTLVRSTQERWQPAALGAATGAEAPPLTLLIDGATRGQISFEPQAAVWRDANGTAWRAPMAPEALRGLQQATAGW